MKRSRLSVVKETDENSNNVDAHSSGTTIEYVSPDVSNSVDSKDDSVKRIKNFWTVLKPQYRSRLFHEIVTSKNIEGTVRDWIYNYEMDPKESIIGVTQLVIDLCGYQDLDVHKMITRSDWYTKVGYILENTEHPDIDNSNKYFLSMQSKRYTQHLEKIEFFFVNIILESHRRKFFTDPEHWLNYTGSIIKDLCKSIKRNIRHTAVYIGLKMITGLIYVLTKVQKKIIKIKKMTGNLEFQELEETNEYCRKVNRVLHVLFKYAFLKNWNLYDKPLFTMRFVCISEINKWLDYMPIINFPLDDVVQILEQALKDPHKQVRFAALRVIYNFLCNEQCKQLGLIKKYFLDLVTAIFKRTNDLDVTVGVYAIDVLGNIDNNVHALPEKIQEQIFYLIYCPEHKMGCAAASFLITKLNKNAKNDEELLLNIIRFQIHIEKKDHYKHMEARRPLIVDSLFNEIPVLTNIETYILLLKNFDLTHREREVMADFLGEVLLILTTGQSTYNRLKKPRPIDVERNNTILKIVCVNIKVWGQYFTLKRFKFLYKFMEDFKKSNPAEFLNVRLEFYSRDLL